MGKKGKVFFIWTWLKCMLFWSNNFSILLLDMNKKSEILGSFLVPFLPLFEQWGLVAWAGN